MGDPAWEHLAHSIGMVGFGVLAALGVGWLIGHLLEISGRRAVETAGSGRKPSTTPVTRQRACLPARGISHVRCYRRTVLYDWRDRGWA